jgi:hypothetical protein
MAMRRALLSVTVVGGFVCFGGCAEPQEECGTPTLEVSGAPTTIVSGDEITVSVTTTNFELRDPEGHTHEDHGDPGEDDLEFRSGGGSCGGHYHVYLDSFEVNPLLMAWEEEQAVTVEGDNGDHEIMVRLNGDDHKILDPDITDSFPIEIVAP